MSDLPVTDPKLITAIADRDKHQEWYCFERTYRPALLAALRKHGLNHADAEDCCQRVLLKLIKNLSSFVDDGKPAAFRRWLFRVARNESISHWRRCAKLPQPTRDSGLVVKCRETFEDSIELEYQRFTFKAVAEEIKQQVDPKHWQAFWQTSVEHKPTPLVAKELGMTVGAVYVAKGRVLKLLQSAVNRLEIKS